MTRSLFTALVAAAFFGSRVPPPGMVLGWRKRPAYRSQRAACAGGVVL